MSCCPICTEYYTLSTRKKTECLYCNYSFCIKCVKKYLLSNMNDPCCMNCKHEWNREFIDLHLSKNFRIKDYKSHRENILFEREKLFFQDTLQLMDINSEQINLCRDEIKKFSNQRKELQKKLSEINNSIFTVRNNLNLLENNPTRVIKDLSHIERKQFIKKCSQNDCKGYINHKGTCGLCKTLICMQCYEIKNENHTCLQENIDSVAQIKKDTKACPKCSVLIYKIDGCRQMWCTQCHTAFDWKTGNVINGRIHNPHYYEWNKNNNIINNNECNMDELPSLGRLRLHYQNINIDILLKKRLFEIHRSINHLQDIEMNRLDENNINNQNDLFNRNLDSRVNYLKSNINENVFKNQLSFRENKIERNRNLFLLYEMISNSIISILHETLTFSKEQIETISIKKIDSLHEYSNEQLNIHCKRFSIRKFNFNTNFVLVRL